MKIEEALEKLFSLHRFGVKLGLENIYELAEFLGNPQNKFPSVHIAGSNGKGSTASFLSSILTESGFKVGLYTSPHLVRFNERIRINGKMIEDERILAFIEKTENYIKKNKPTFFELTTALAFEYFAENNVDVAVIETGLGGRLDATNIIKPRGSVITTISLEHENILGNTIEKIAGEKAGIIKPETPVFTGILSDKAFEVIENKSLALHSHLFPLNRYLTTGQDFVKIGIENFQYTVYSKGLRGRYQFFNAALAILVAFKLFDIRDYQKINRGLLNVAGNTGISGRYEVVKNNPLIIFDAAHNLECLHSFVEEFKHENISKENSFVIFGAMKDKDIKGMLKILSKYFGNIYVTTIEYQRAANIKELTDAAAELNIKVRPIEFKKIESFIKDFLENKREKALAMLGSIYIIGEIKRSVKI